MKVVVADSSPVNYLVLIGQIEILQQLYSGILLPSAVFYELTAPAAPRPVSDWVRKHPSWVKIQETVPELSIFSKLDPFDLDAGEKAALALALDARDALLLIDEAMGRSAAARLGIAHTGTLGILLDAARANLLDLRAAMEALKTTSFRMTQALADRVIAASLR